jgi:hypothetical protein
MREFANRKVRRSSSGPIRLRGRRKGVEDVSKEDKEGPEKRPNKSGRGDTELPPNENLKKDADEAYGDTEIPGRKHDV